MSICIYKSKYICGLTTYKKVKMAGKSLQTPPGLTLTGANRPAPPNCPGANPAPINRGPTNPPQSLQTPANRPQKTGPTRKTPTDQTRANQLGPIKRGQSNGANKPRQTNHKQSPKQSPNCWGPIAPQTNQTTNPNQSPAKPKQPRKREFEVSAN